MGIAQNEPTSLLAYDNFEQEAGNLEGKTMPFPAATTWAETNKTGASGFLVDATNHRIERTATGDTNTNSGCFALAGTTSYSTFSSSVLALGGSIIRSGLGRLGLLGRYASTEKWVMATLVAFEAGTLYLAVYKNVSGTVTQIGAFTPTNAGERHSTFNYLNTNLQIVFNVAANGAWSARCGAAAISGQDADLAVGGVLASGRAGLYDALQASGGTTTPRYLDSFQLMGAEEPGQVCYSGKQVEFRSDGVQRQDSTGTYDGPPTQARGGNFLLEPGGNSGAINRIAVRMRRNDVEAETDSAVTDKQSVTVMVTERFLIPR